MGLAPATGGAGAGGGSAKLDGITAPPAGKPNGRATPETAKQRQDKQTLRDKLGSGGLPGASIGGAGLATPVGQAAAPPAPAETQPAAPPPPGPPRRPVDDGGSVETMIEQLDTSDDPATRLRAAQGLAASRAPKAKPALERALRDRDQAVAAAAMAALQQIV